MLSGKAIKFHNTLAFKLTLWYATIFSLSSILAFLFFYVLVTSVIREQTDRELLDRAAKFSTLLSVEGIEAVQSVAVAESRAGGVKKTFIRLLYLNGRVFSSSNMSYWRDIGVDNIAIRELIKKSTPVFDTVTIPDRRHKVRICYGFIGSDIIIQVGQSMELSGSFIEAFRKIFVSTMVFLLLIAAAIGWFMARRALSGVEAVTKTARLISQDALEKRVPVKPRGDEIDQLARTFNSMLDRMQELISGMKEMSDNIAHDLKSPITRIRGIAEITLTTGKSLPEYESMAASIVEESDRLLNMINTMLVISKMEAGVGELGKIEMNLARVTREACELFNPIAEDKGITLTSDLPNSLSFTGDVGKIQRMISNLIDNAIKYTSGGGSVRVSLEGDHDGRIRLRVRDDGVGIDEKNLPHIFERFYRCDHSRSEEGTGLGLSLARAIARAHGGDITAESRTSEGSTFTVTLNS
ncbi:MAG: HAMP domain-containing protein [Deltaproteobacteria bacterium]|nr:HAMP domain-containing protein [Deltaproteobacteria bacterium]